MLVFLQTATSLRSLEVDPSTPISQILADLQESSLSFGGRPLRSDLCMGDYGVMEGSTLEVLDALLGGMAKRKKKQFTTPKKKHHQHKKEKLAVLKLYKVDSSEKVTRTRKNCPVCGAAVFMAKHKNRFYCGKCHTTMAFKQ